MGSICYFSDRKIKDKLMVDLGINSNLEDSTVFTPVNYMNERSFF